MPTKLLSPPNKISTPDDNPNAIQQTEGSPQKEKQAKTQPSKQLPVHAKRRKMEETTLPLPLL